MRAGRRSVALVALGIWPVACAVYDDESLMPSGGDATGAEAASAGSSGASSSGGTGGSTSAAGNDSGKSGGGTPGAAGSAMGGHVEPGGGSANTAEGGDAAGGAGEMPQAGSVNGGSSGTAGHGGTSAGAGGISGTGGGGGMGGKAGGGMGGGGTAGTGGMPGGPLCSDHPLTARASWVASASHYDMTNSGVPANLLDDTKTRWSTGKAQSGNEWLQIDFGATVTLNHVNLQQGDDVNDYPRGYSIIVSDTPKDLSGTAKLTGSGKSGVSTAILLPALASGRYLLIKQTGSSLSWWSAEEIEISCAD